MTPDQRFSFILAGLGVGAALVGWVLRTLLSSIRDTIERNNKAIGDLTASVNELNKKMAFLEGQQRRGRQ
jgi:hypothetical protein